MRYLESLSDFFKSPRWTMNLLLAAVCSLIPIVGPMVVHGWLIGGFWGRASSDPATFPDFDFNRFTKYLTRGLWPFLVSLVFGLALMVVIMLLEVVVGVAMAVLAGGGGGHHGHVSGVLAVLAMLVGFMMYLLLIVGFIVILKPFFLRAELMQDFGKAFDFRFARRFIKLTWVECVVSSLFVVAASIVLMTAGMLVLCVGMYLAMGPLYFMTCHLNKQIYQIFLARGGEAVPFSPLLRDDPPPMPV